MEKELSLKNCQAKTSEDKLKYLENENAKNRKLKTIFATEIFRSDRTNEDLDILLELDAEVFFEKYEKFVKAKIEKDKETTENNVKTMLKLQRESYEEQLCEIMDHLNIPSNHRCFSNIVQAIKDLKESREKNESALYDNAESVLKYFPSTSNCRK